MIARILFVLLFLVSSILWGGCARSQSEAEASIDTAANNTELARIFEQDQAARENMNFEPGDIEAIRAFIKHDSLRRMRVRKLLNEGKARTADDYYHAAMVFQHGGGTTAYRKAHELSKKAVALDSTHHAAKWLTAASWDRYLMEQGKPQWYGTQFTRQAGEKWELYQIDTTKVTDRERTRLGMPTLEEARARVDSLNAQLHDENA